MRSHPRAAATSCDSMPCAARSPALPGAPLATFVSTLVNETVFGFVVIACLVGLTAAAGWLPALVAVPDAKAFRVLVLRAKRRPRRRVRARVGRRVGRRDSLGRAPRQRSRSPCLAGTPRAPLSDHVRASCRGASLETGCYGPRPRSRCSRRVGSTTRSRPRSSCAWSIRSLGGTVHARRCRRAAGSRRARAGRRRNLHADLAFSSARAPRSSTSSTTRTRSRRGRASRCSPATRSSRVRSALPCSTAATPDTGAVWGRRRGVPRGRTRPVVAS